MRNNHLTFIISFLSSCLNIEQPALRGFIAQRPATKGSEVERRVSHVQLDGASRRTPKKMPTIRRNTSAASSNATCSANGIFKKRLFFATSRSFTILSSVVSGSLSPRNNQHLILDLTHQSSGMSVCAQISPHGDNSFSKTVEVRCRVEVHIALMT